MKKSIALILAFVMVLGMIPGTVFAESPAPQQSENPFVDVEESQYYYAPVLWAVENGITNGMTPTTFEPLTTCNRAQIVTFLWRAAGSPAPANRINPFVDVPAGTWYTDAVLWATENGITNGMSADTFGPMLPCTRAHAVTFLWRAYGAQSSEAATSSFEDIPETAYYRDAVLWAEENGITLGVTEDAFVPEMPCQRGQIVTFLYRSNNLSGPGMAQVTFMRNDGTPGAYRMEVVSIGSRVQKPEDPTLEMYGFQGWYLDPHGITPFNFNSRIRGDTFLYAKWGNPNGDDEGVYAAGSGGGTNFSITAIESAQQQVKVTLNTNTSAVLVVRFYEDTQELYHGDFTADGAPALIAQTATRTPDYCEQVPVVLPVDAELPEYYYVTADLYDEQGEKLCETFVGIEQTARHEAFEATTVSDFEAEQVIQFSDDTTNNFGVLQEEVARITSTPTQNSMTTSKLDGVHLHTQEDDAPTSYTFTNPSAEVLALEVGDCVYIDGTNFMFKIGAITKSADAVTVVEDPDVYLTDFYEFLKIDMYIVNEDQSDPAAVSPNAELVDEKVSYQLSPNIAWTPEDWLEMTGTANIKGLIQIKIEYDIELFAKDYFYIKVVNDLDIGFTGTVTCKLTNEEAAKNAKPELIKIEAIRVDVPTPVPLLSVKVEAGLPIELEAKASMNFTLNHYAKGGFTYSSYNGVQNIDQKNNTVHLNFQGEVSIKAGPSLTIGIAFAKEVLEAELEVGAGIKLTGKTNEFGPGDPNPDDPDEDTKHGCDLCVDVKVQWYLEETAALKYKIVEDVLEAELFKWEIINVEGNFPISPNFYVSVLNSEDSCFGGRISCGWGDCPNQSHRTVFIVENEDGEELFGLWVKVVSQNGTTSYAGQSPYAVYLYEGTYNATATIEGREAKKSAVIPVEDHEVVLTPDSDDGNVFGNVVDKDTLEPIEGAVILATRNGIMIDSTTSAENGDYSMDLPEGDYSLQTYKDDYRPFTEYVTVHDDQTNYLQTTYLVPDEEGRGGFAGRIVDNVTNQPIAGVQLQLRGGWGNDGNGAVSQTLYTDGNGEFRYDLREMYGVTIGLVPGNYTITASKEGYTTTTHNILVEPDVVLEGQNFSMSPSMGEGQYRIRLSWGASPSDLDSHMIAPLAGGGTFHLYYPYAQANGSHPYSNYFSLDLDDTSSYGPETTTIHIPVEGTYTFYVHNYSETPSLATSGAQVEVYQGDTILARYNVPANLGNALYWYVFELNPVTGTITPYNVGTDVVPNGAAAYEPPYLYQIAADIANHLKK